MMMNDQELIEQSKQAISLGYEHIGKIEALTMTKDNIYEGSVSVLMPDGALMDLNVLTEEQVVAVKKYICLMLDEGLKESRKYLMRLNHIPAVGNQDFEEAVKEMVEQAPAEVIKEAVQETVEAAPAVDLVAAEPVIPEVIKKKPGRPKKEAAKREPEEADLVEKEVPVYPELDPKLVRRMYIDEGKNLQEVATYFGKTKKEFREYIEKNRIFRPIKSPEGFRD